MAAAQKVIAERGPDRAGLKDVAREAGVSHALVSHYFGTFERLVEAALEAHVETVRQRFVTQLEAMTATGQADIEGLIDQFFESLSSPLYARLAGWALLSGRADATDFFPRRQQGLRAIAETIDRGQKRALGEAAFSREKLDFVLVLLVTAGFGYALGSATFWESLGRSPSKERDAAFRADLARLVRHHLFGAAADQ